MIKVLITADGRTLRGHSCNECIAPGMTFYAQPAWEETEGYHQGYHLCNEHGNLIVDGHVEEDMVKVLNKRSKIKNYKLSVKYEKPVNDSREESYQTFKRIKQLDDITSNIQNLYKSYGKSFKYLKDFNQMNTSYVKGLKRTYRNRIKHFKTGKSPVYQLTYKNLVRRVKPKRRLTPREVKKLLLNNLDLWIKEERSYRKISSSIVNRSFHGVPYQLQKGVHIRQGTILELFKQSFMLRVRSEKKPQTKDNYIGVELEFTSPLNEEQIIENLAKKGLGKYVTLKGDGSIRCTEGDNPYEICILAKQDEYKEVVKKVCKTINDECEAGVNSTCGLHVHLDMRNREGKTCAKKLFNTQDLLYSMIPKRRRTHQYCRKLDSFNFDTRPSGERYDHGRYYGLNFKALQKFNTIEVRLHSGSTNHKKINNWIDLLLNIVDNDVSKKVTKLDELNEIVKMDEKLSQYLKTRVEAFN